MFIVLAGGVLVFLAMALVVILLAYFSDWLFSRSMRRK
jgi:hypothetical protein